MRMDSSGEKTLVAIDRRLKRHAFSVILRSSRQGSTPEIRPEPVRIGLSQAAKRCRPPNFLRMSRLGLQPQVKRISQHNLCADAGQFVRRHGLYRPIGAHRHEDWGFDLFPWQDLVAHGGRFRPK